MKKQERERKTKGKKERQTEIQDTDVFGGQTGSTDVEEGGVGFHGNGFSLQERNTHTHTHV